jgi:RND family efflux transporter MFP subunit
MRTAFAILVVATFLACNSSSSSSNLDKLKSRKDSLQMVYDEIGTQLKEVQAEISALDTTNKRKLHLVEAVKLEAQPFNHYLKIFGTIDSDKFSTLSAEMPGIVKRIHVKTGQKVGAGQTLISFDTEMVRKGIAEAEVQYDLAKTVYEKQKKLWDQKIGSEMQMIQAETNKTALEKKISTLKHQLSKSTVVAPFTGTIDEIFVKAGEVASPGFPTVRILNIGNVYAVAAVSEKFISTIKVGTPVVLTVGDKEIVAKVSRTGNFIEAANRTYKVEVDLKNASGMFKPNMLVDMKINDYQSDSAIIVSTNVIQEDTKGNSFVYTLQTENGKKISKKTMVTLGKVADNKIEILSGLKANDLLVTKGARNIRDNEIVKVVE